MCDDKVGAVFGQLIHRFMDNQFGTGVYQRVGFVQDQHGMIMHHGTGDGQQLLLSVGDGILF